MPRYISKILAANSAALTEAKKLLRQGEVVALPSETVYGLAGNAFDADACSKIFAAKGRPAFDPLIVHIAKSWGDLPTLQAKGLVDLSSIPEILQIKLQTLMQTFWPGPLTLVLPRGPKIPDIVTNALPSVAIRMPAHPIFQEILENIQVPLAAPSANRFAHVSPTTAQHVFDDLSGKIPLIIDGGPCELGVESTIIGFDDEFQPTLFRRGALAIENILQTTAWTNLQQLQTGKAIVAPGLLDRHYAPEKPLFFLDADGDWAPAEGLGTLHKIAIVSLYASLPIALAKQAQLFDEEQYFLSPSPESDQDGRIAAKNLFSILRLLEKSAVDVILVETPRQNHGLWPAIHDRLSKAGYQKA